MRNLKNKNGNKIILWVFIILFLVVLTIGLAPVSFDSIICRTGFKEHMVDEYAHQLGEMFLYNHKHNSMISYNIVPDSKELVQNMEWEGRKIKTKATIEFEGDNYLVEYEGKRYWVEKYNWNLVSITLKEIVSNTKVDEVSNDTEEKTITGTTNNSTDDICVEEESYGENEITDEESDVIEEKTSTVTIRNSTEFESVEEQIVEEKEITEEEAFEEESSEEGKDISEGEGRQAVINVGSAKNSVLEVLGIADISKEALAVIINNPSEEILNKISELKKFKYQESDESLLIIPIYNNMTMKVVTYEWDEDLQEKDVLFSSENSINGFGLHLNATRPCGIPNVKITIEGNGMNGEYILAFNGKDGTPDVEYIEVKLD